MAFIHDYYQKKREETLARIEAYMPDEMTSRDNWAIFKVYRGDDGKKKKVILDVHTGSWASSKNSATWSAFCAAKAYCLAEFAQGLSFCLTGSGITCIDLDGCIGDDGKLTELAERVLALTTSLTERSVSGKGLHVFLKGNFMKGYKVRADEGLEVFDNKFISLTGDVLDGRTELQEPSDELVAFLKERLQKKPTVYQTSYESPYKQSSDDVVFKKISRSKCADEFTRLYAGEDIKGNPSMSDYRLFGILIYFCNGDKSQVLRLFRNSGLYRESKGEKYLETTFQNALKTTQFFEKTRTKKGS